MNNETRQTRRWRNSMKSSALLISILLLISVTLGGTIAYLAVSGTPLKNTFNPSRVTTSVVEDFDGTVKENVKIKNNNDSDMNTDAWIRATVVINWKNDTGDVYGQAPVATDYTIDWNTDNWIKGEDGFWYYYKPVPVGGTTENLIDSCAYVENAPDGYHLSVEILGSGIQNKPVAAFNAWAENSGIKVNFNKTDPLKSTLSKAATN